MAERLDSFPFRATSGRYPWDEWLDGSVWQLRRGVDFTCTVTTMRSAFRQAAARRHLATRTASPDAGTLVAQAVKK